MKRYNLLITVLIPVLFVFFCTKEETKTVNIGAILPLTGSASIWGKNAQMGMEIALEELNNQGGINNKKLLIQYEDSQSEPDKAVSALQKIISTTNIKVIIGDIASSNVLAMAPIAEKNKILLLSPGASNPKISDAGEYIFRNWQSDALEAEVDASFAIKQLKWKNVAVSFVDNAYGTGLATYFINNFEKLGGKIMAKESFKQGETDFRTVLTKLNNLKIDGLYLPGYPPEMGRFLKQMVELGVKLNILSVQAFDDPEIIKIAGNGAEGVIYSVPTPPDTTDKIVYNFRNKYMSKFNKQPGVCSDTGYDALKLIVEAIKSNGYSSDGIKSYFLNLKDFNGASGMIEFDKNGDVLKPFSFYKISTGNPQLLEHK